MHNPALSENARNEVSSIRLFVTLRNLLHPYRTFEGRLFQPSDHVNYSSSNHVCLKHATMVSKRSKYVTSKQRTKITSNRPKAHQVPVRHINCMATGFPGQDRKGTSTSKKGHQPNVIPKATARYSNTMLLYSIFNRLHSYGRCYSKSEAYRRFGKLKHNGHGHKGLVVNPVVFASRNASQ